MYINTYFPTSLYEGGNFFESGSLKLQAVWATIKGAVEVGNSLSCPTDNQIIGILCCSLFI